MIAACAISLTLAGVIVAVSAAFAFRYQPIDEGRMRAIDTWTGRACTSFEGRRTYLCDYPIYEK